MIDKDNFKDLLKKLDFTESGDILFKDFPDIDAQLKVDFKNSKLIYPVDKGFTISGEFTTSFSQKENFVVFECVHRLFDKGYKPQHIELEPKWTVGHGASGGRADIMVKDNSGKSLLIIECKTAGREFDDEWKKTLINGGQVLSYAKQAGSTQYVALYTSDILDDKVIPGYYLIVLKDNEKLLEELVDKEPLSYEKAKLLDKEDIYEAWKETYALDYATKGIFETDIPAYEIGKTKYSLTDLDPISSNDIQGKYHQFATILRQHNVSGHENAFDKLVNLFLCKIVDETNNPEELKFYWKGIAYDSFFELQDRMQKLYQEGMKRFLGEEVTYIDNEAIDQAFRFFKNDPDATKETIKKYFRELKFFTNNDFAFIDVHNEKLFYQNAAVLLKIVQMLQDIRLKDEEQEHQFLGDMFEGFLDQGVKQSEGQFFTPMPIVKFILKSLPLEQIITANDNIPKVIDYACGAGHFLNVYAQEIKPIVEAYKETEIEKYYENVIGVEKEYRLSKVAKVSAFMYGQDDIKIIYADALATIPTIKENEYSVIVANPPYSVKGFLETLSETDRKKYQLIDAVGEKSYPNNNSIETFFIERAKQLLKTDGVAGIIVPSSILTKGKTKSTSKSTSIYVATREILLKYFDIVAIAEFGSGTFGKTGTNTATLFIRRKKDNPAPADHYKNRIESWFKGDKTKEGVFEDEHFIKSYCKHLELQFEDYQTLFAGKPNKELLETEIFKEYQKEFNKWAEVKNRKKQKTFKALKKEEQQTELEKRFNEYVLANEKDKLYYFVLASINPQKVLIIKSPIKTKQIKEFLGYDWSSAKGKEGIKYLGGITLDEIKTSVENDDEIEEDEILEADDRRVLENIFNLENINTPLYDPKDNSNEEKINHLINLNFKKENFEIPEDLVDYVKKANLVEMIDFSRLNFNKEIKTSPKNLKPIVSKHPYMKIDDVFLEVKNGKNVNQLDNGGKFKVSRIESIAMGVFNSLAVKWTNDKVNDDNFLKKGDILFSHINSVEHLAKTAYFDIDEKIVHGVNILRFRPNQLIVIPKYVANLFKLTEFTDEIKSQAQKAINQASVNTTYLKEIKIPIPDKSIQEKIVKECSILDKEIEKAEKILIIQINKIQQLVTSAYQTKDIRKIIDVIDINSENFDPTSKPKDKFIYVDIKSVKKGQGIIEFKKTIIGRNAPSRARRIASIGSTIVSTVRPYLKGFAFVKAQPADTIYSTGFAVLKSKDESVILNKMIYLYFMFSEYLMIQMEAAMPKAAYPSINKEDIENFKIPIPKIAEQNKIVKDFEKAENKITEAQNLIEGTAKRKEEIIRKFL